MTESFPDKEYLPVLTAPEQYCRNSRQWTSCQKGIADEIPIGHFKADSS